MDATCMPRRVLFGATAHAKRNIGNPYCALKSVLCLLCPLLISNMRIGRISLKVNITGDGRYVSVVLRIQPSYLLFNFMTNFYSFCTFLVLYFCLIFELFSIVSLHVLILTYTQLISYYSCFPIK